MFRVLWGWTSLNIWGVSYQNRCTAPRSISSSSLSTAGTDASPGAPGPWRHRVTNQFLIQEKQSSTDTQIGVWVKASPTPKNWAPWPGRGQVAGPRPSSVKSDVDGASQVALGEVGKVPAMATTEFASKFRFQKPHFHDSGTKEQWFCNQDSTIPRPKNDSTTEILTTRQATYQLQGSHRKPIYWMINCNLYDPNPPLWKLYYCMGWVLKVVEPS